MGIPNIISFLLTKLQSWSWHSALPLDAACPAVVLGFNNETHNAPVHQSTKFQQTEQCVAELKSNQIKYICDTKKQKANVTLTIQ